MKKRACGLRRLNGLLYVYATRLDITAAAELLVATDEPVRPVHWRDPALLLVPNLRWLLPLCLDNAVCKVRINSHIPGEEYHGT
jgi:hypothetical protein